MFKNGTDNVISFRLNGEDKRKNLKLRNNKLLFSPDSKLLF